MSDSNQQPPAGGGSEVGLHGLVLPCPFCGQKPKFTEHFREKGLFNMLHRCRVVGVISWEWSDLERQIARWNTRDNAIPLV